MHLFKRKRQQHIQLKKSLMHFEEITEDQDVKHELNVALTEVVGGLKNDRDIVTELIATLKTAYLLGDYQPTSAECHELHTLGDLVGIDREKVDIFQSLAGSY